MNEDPYLASDSQARRPADDGGGESPVILPGVNAEVGLSGQVSGTVGPLIAPVPLVDRRGQLDDGDGGDGDDLADRIEQALADDGRFASLLPRLEFAARGGVVTLSGPVPNPDLKRSLLATVRAIPGVEDVEDRLTV